MVGSSKGAAISERPNIRATDVENQYGLFLDLCCLKWITWRLLSVVKNPKVDAEMLAAAERTNARIREHYLGLPGKTEEGWRAVKQNPANYNLVWRHMLNLLAGDTPPNLGG